ncbi:type II secretion system F family protein [Halarchaeum sp. CBA1220]|uniref:type II secretion system F family protein n=1 Tax=Halarchaeum sp. CBA1220 TaxID=1853682 RepID=UPI000F3A91DB|nr:type II secretion system F family protein [Halarchaeum sp. CBA1220]QLC34461.1 type II secretion system F family protein [Halarchaeum sp. CBA1220]
MSFENESTFGSGDLLAQTFYPLYQWLFDDSSDFVADVETKLAEARRDETVELFLSRALGIGVIVGLVLWALGTLAGWALFATGVIPTEDLVGLYIPSQAVADFLDLIKVPALVLVTGLFFGTIGFAAGFGGLVGIPYMTAGERKREINMLLPDAVAFMYALSMGGMNQLEILEAMAKADDTYGEVALEFRSIVQETQYFDTDYRTAVRNRSLETPSDELSQFLTDMLSIVNSGGDMTSFLSDKKDKHMRTAKQQQELTLDTLELFGEMFMTLSLFPLLLIIILVIMSMLGQSQDRLLYGTVYALIPLVGVGFLVLVSTVKEDEPGDGYLRLQDGEGGEETTSREPGLLNLGLIERFKDGGAIFERIYDREGTHEAKWVFTHPHLFFKRHPLYTLGLTVPVSVVILALAVSAGTAPTTLQGMQDRAIAGTFVWVYVPMYLVFLPLAAFREWNERSRHRITNKLSDDLRKLSSANDTGLTLLESIKTVSDTSSGKLGEEFKIVYAKVNYGTSLRDALVEFNNKYHIPRLARTVKLVSKAQEASSQISAVLTTAAQASENQDDIERERKSRTRMQVVIIIMTYLTLLAVMAILKVRFLDVMAGLATQASGGGGAASQAGGGSMSFGGGIDTQKLNMMFFHAVTIQGVLSGFIAGYIRDADLLSGVKFAVVLPTVALVVFTFI